MRPTRMSHLVPPGIAAQDAAEYDPHRRHITPGLPPARSALSTSPDYIQPDMENAFQGSSAGEGSGSGPSKPGG